MRARQKTTDAIWRPLSPQMPSEPWTKVSHTSEPMLSRRQSSPASSGAYSGTCKATDKTMRAALAHLYEVTEGSITQYVDTLMVQRALPDA